MGGVATLTATRYAKAYQCWKYQGVMHGQRINPTVPLYTIRGVFSITRSFRVGDTAYIMCTDDQKITVEEMGKFAQLLADGRVRTIEVNLSDL